MDSVWLPINFAYMDQTFAQECQGRERLLCELSRRLHRFCWTDGGVSSDLLAWGKGTLMCWVSHFHGENIPPKG